MSFESFLENISKFDAEREKRIKDLEKLSPLKIGEIIPDKPKPVDIEETPDWYKFLTFFLRMRPKQRMKIPIKYLLAVRTALDSISKDLRKGSDFNVKFEVENEKVTNILLERTKE